MTEQLPEQFIGTGEVKGLKFTRIATGIDKYLYEVESNGSTHYELIKRLKSPVCIDFEKRIYSDTEFKEYYPKSSRFGIDAWSFYSREKAFKKWMNENT